MRLLKQHPDETGADEPGVDETAVAERRAQGPAEEWPHLHDGASAGTAGAGEP